MQRAGKILDADRFSLTGGKLRQPVLDVVVDSIIDCFTKHYDYPEIWVWTDSQQTRRCSYKYSPVIVLHLGNKINKIFYTKFISTPYHLYSPNDEAFHYLNTQRLTKEGIITIAVAKQLFGILSAHELSWQQMQLHFDYNLDEDLGSHAAYQEIQKLIHTQDFLDEKNYYFKPHALWATKAADMILRKTG
jgi:predicted RNase H-related nuclease YkuK (DUF458 family)